MLGQGEFEEEKKKSRELIIWLKEEGIALGFEWKSKFYKLS